MDTLYVGFTRNVELPKGGCLLIDDEVREVPDWKRPKIFDPLEDGFNVLEGMDHIRARDIADILYSAYPQGENTLTVRKGRRGLLKGLLKAKRLDAVEGDDEVSELIDDLFVSPVLRQALCVGRFSFNPKSVIMARLNRKELGDFDAFVIGQFLMSHYKGQIVVPDFGFYGRDRNVSLIAQGRLTVGVNFLDELSPKLRNSVLFVEDKVVSGAIAKDARELAEFGGLVPGTMEFNDFVGAATRSRPVTVQV